MVYVRKKDCSEEGVNKLLNMGFELKFITPVIEEVRKRGQLSSSETKLVYHFVKKEEDDETE